MTSKDKFPMGMVFLAALSFLIGIAGYILQDPFWLKPSMQSAAQSLLDALYAVILTFFLDAPKTVSQQGQFGFWSWVLINIARILAPLSLAGAVFSVLSGFWRPIVDRWKIAMMRRHIIVLGSGTTARAFLHNAIRTSSHIVNIVASDEEKSIIEAEFEQKFLVIVSNSPNQRNWKRMSVSKASDIVLVTDDDCINLTAMSLIKSLWPRSLKSNARCNMFVHVNDEQLRAELIAQTGRFSGHGTLSIQPISINELSARYFFHHHDFFYETMANGFERVHWLIFGLSNTSIALINQFIKVSAYSKLKTPHISLVVPDTKSAHALVAQKYAEIGELVKIHIYELDKFDMFPNMNLARSIEKEAPVSSIFIALCSDAKNQNLATSLAGMRTRSGHFKANIYLESFGENTNWVERTGNFKSSDAHHICALAAPINYCSLAYIKGPLDKTAQAFHGAYASKMADKVHWNELDENYKQANRRAADHAKTKLESLGFIGTLEKLLLPKDNRLEIDEKIIEPLAKLEHKSWAADRILNDWRYGSNRDNQKRIHPNLVAYEKLDEKVKNLDRQQVVMLLNQVLKPGEGGNIQRRVRIGLIGHNAISIADATRIKSRLNNEILPDIAKRYRQAQLNFFSPMAPGSDLVMVSTTLKNFENLHKNWCCQIVSTMPVQDIVRHYAHNWQSGNTWNGVEDNAGGKSLSADWPEASLNIVAHLKNVPRTEPKISEVIDLMPPFRGAEYWDSAENSEAAFVRGGRHMAHTADILIAFLDPSRMGGVGGTKYTIDLALERGVQVMLI